MPDLFDEFNKIFKKDFVPILANYFKDPNNKITDNLNDFLNDPKRLLTDLLENFSENKDYDNNKVNYTDVQKLTDIEPPFDDEYEELFKRLLLIEEDMIQIEKILKDKN
tara:strand:- start:18 stop:344 length:327 start_codon:yes stop_codon:yes gene_type:complete